MLEHNIMKPWREIAVPHPDVLKGTFQQSEFAADITAVHTGKATPEYQDATAFFERTFITEGMGLLLTPVHSGSMARAASRSSNCKQPSAAARRTRCWRSITWPRASARSRTCLASRRCSITRA